MQLCSFSNRPIPSFVCKTHDYDSFHLHTVAPTLDIFLQQPLVTPKRGRSVSVQSHSLNFTRPPKHLHLDADFLGVTLCCTFRLACSSFRQRLICCSHQPTARPCPYRSTHAPLHILLVIVSKCVCRMRTTKNTSTWARLNCPSTPFWSNCLAGALHPKKRSKWANRTLRERSPSSKVLSQCTISKVFSA